MAFSSTPRLRKVFACLRCCMLFLDFAEAEAHYLSDPRHDNNKILLATLGVVGHARAVASTIDVLVLASPAEAAAARAEAIGNQVVEELCAVAALQQMSREPVWSPPAAKPPVTIYVEDWDRDSPPKKRRRISDGYHNTGTNNLQVPKVIRNTPEVKTSRPELVHNRGRLWQLNSVTKAGEPGQENYDSDCDLDG